jgi:alkyl hydroperoxide reductase subunit AhpC
MGGNKYKYGINILLKKAKKSPKPANGHFLVITKPDYFQYIKFTMFFKPVDFVCVCISTF